jgi:hypothetical protein
MEHAIARLRKEVNWTSPLPWLIAGTVIELVSIGALNGGTALAASAFDGLKTQITTWLSSSLVLALAFVSLFVGVWQLSHGRGYGTLGYVLGILTVALIGPTFVTTVASATRDPLAAIEAHGQRLTAATPIASTHNGAPAKFTLVLDR